MTRRERLIRRFLSRPAELRYADVLALLGEFGFEANRQRGSHVAFTKPGEAPIVISLVSGRRVKRGYIEEIIDRLGLEE